jgi:hypothetical protein
VGEAAKAGDHIPVPAGEVGGAGITEPLEQRQRDLLDRQVFRVHQRHQPELPPRLLGFPLQPAALPSLQAQRQGPLCQERSPPGLTSSPGGQPNHHETDL